MRTSRARERSPWELVQLISSTSTPLASCSCTSSPPLFSSPSDARMTTTRYSPAAIAVPASSVMLPLDP